MAKNAKPTMDFILDLIYSIIGILIFIIIPIYLSEIGERSMRKSIKNQAKCILGNIFFTFGKMNMRFGRKIAETKKEQQLREANKVISDYNHMIYFAYFFDSYHDKENTTKQLREYINLNLVKSSLEILDLSYERWIQAAYKLYYWGIIVSLSRIKIGYNRYYQDVKYIRNDIVNRSNIINSEYKYQHVRGTILIKEALEFFNIPENEWIEYGDAVVNMKNIDFDTDIIYIAHFNPLDIWQDNINTVELVQYRDFQSNDYKSC